MTAPANKTARPTGAPRVLVVDDSAVVRQALSQILGHAGMHVEVAADPIIAIERIRRQRPDALVLDIEMPRMDGFEFTKTIKSDARNANIPIVMITSRTAEKHRNRARELGVDLFLGKPFQEEELIRNLREMLSLATPA